MVFISTSLDPNENGYGEHLHAYGSSSVSGNAPKAPKRTYDEFDTVDWVKDLNADSDRRARMEQRALVRCLIECPPLFYFYCMLIAYMFYSHSILC